MSTEGSTLSRPALWLLGGAMLMALAGCDMLGIESASAVAAKREAEGKAVGAACRHAGRAIEDCYTLNKKTDKGAVFAGWREMNDYMRENKIEAVPPQIAAATEVAAKKPDDGEGDEPDPKPKADKGDKADKPAKGDKPEPKPAKAAAKH